MTEHDKTRLEYCIQAWSPYHKKDIEVLERVQKRATKMVYGYGNLNYKDILSLLELPSLEERRVRRFDRGIYVAKRYSLSRL